MSFGDPRLLVPDLVFPESPRWRDGRLWFADMYAGTVMTTDLAGATETVLSWPGRLSGIGFLPDGTPLVTAMAARHVLRLDGGAAPAVHADLSGLVSSPINDMLVDPQGRAYVGSFGFDFVAGDEPATTSLLLVEPDGTARVVADDLLFPNGMALSPDGGTLYLSETFRGVVTAFDVAGDGGLSGRRTFATLTDRTPDGLSLDADGHLWVASSLTGEVLLVAEGGAILERIDVGDRVAPACLLGGEDGRTLFLLLAEATTEELATGASRGTIETVRVDVPKAGLP